MKIALIGSKGIPASHGGVERHVEEIAVRLARQGHEITVFGRDNYRDRSAHPDPSFAYSGVRVIYLPGLSTKNLDAFSGTLAAVLKSLRQGFDIYHFQAVGPSSLAFLPRICGKKVICTIHARDYQRSKWGRLARAYLKWGERIIFRSAQAVISVSATLAAELEREYHHPVHYIPNGFNLPEPEGETRPSILLKHGLDSGRYILFVGRLSPEKGLHYLLEAFRKIPTDYRLVIAGGESFSDQYVKKLRDLADARVVFTGYVYGRDLATLYRHCCFLVLPSELEGLPITVLEAMSLGKAVLVSDLAENLEITAPSGRPALGYSFRQKSSQDLLEKIAWLLAHPEEREATARQAREYVQKTFNWDIIAQQTEAVYRQVDQAARSGR